MQLHLLSIQVDINHVKLNIRFPGQLTFQLKNPHLYRDIQQMFPLTNGECKVQQSIVIEVQAVYNPTNQTYAEVSADLIISINTTNGKIVAGIVNFNTVQNVTANFSLKRCSDKTASLAMRISYTKINKIKQIQAIQQPQQSSPINNYSSPMIIAHLSSNLNETGDNERQRASSRSSQKIRQLMISSRVKPSGVNQRLKQMEQSNSRRLKIINKEKEETQAQLEQTKQRYRLTQRRQKELQTTIKQLKQANQKKRVKISELQFKLGDYQKITTENQKRIRQLHQQLKQSKQQLEQLISKNGLLQKRYEARQQTTNQKQKRFLEKIAQLQAEQTKIAHEYNDLLQKMENQEKNNQLFIKNKEKSYLEERLKLKEQLDSLEKSYKTLSEQNSDFINKNVSITQLQKSLQLKIVELQNGLEKKEIQVATLTNEMERFNRNRLQMEKELQIAKEVQIEKSSLKKKLTQQYQQNQKMKDKLDKLTLEYQQLKQNHNQQDIHLNQMRSQKKNMQIKLFQFQKLNNSLQKDILRLTVENNGLSSKNTYLNERLNDLKTKIEQQQRQFAQKQANYQGKINSILQSRQYAISDSQDLKWSLQKQKENVLQTQRKLKERNQRILEQQQLIINLKKQIDQDKIKAEELSYTIEIHQQQITKFKIKSQEFLQANKEHEQKEFLLLKKIAQIEQENYININKLRKTNLDQQQSIELQSNNLEKLKSELQNKMNSLQSLQLTYNQLLDSYSELQRNFKLQTMSLDEADRLNLTNQEKLQELKKANQQLKQQLQFITNGNETKSLEFQQKFKGISKKYEQSQKISRIQQTNLETYKKAVQQLFIIISSDETQKSEDLIAVPDSQLSKIQIQALLYRNKHISQLKSQNIELEVEINYLQKENESKTKIIQQKVLQNQNIIRQYNNRIAKIEEKFQQQKKDWLNKQEQISNQLTSVKSEKQKLENRVKSLSQLYQEQKTNKLQACNMTEFARQTIRKLEISLLDIKSREINKKNEDESTIHNLKVAFNGEIQLYKQKINALLKQKQSIERSCLDKDKNNQLLKTKISQNQIQKQKLERLISKLNLQNGALSNAKAQLEQNIYQKLTRIAFFNESVEKLNLQLKGLKEINAEITTKLNNAHTQISELSVKKEKLQNKLKVHQNNYKSSNQEQKLRIVTLDQLLLSQTKKSNKLHEQLSKVSNELQIKLFQTKQIELKLQSTEKTLLQVRKDNQEKRNQISKQDLAIQALKRAIYGVQKQKSQHNLQKEAVQEELLNQKSKNALLEDELKHFKDEIDNLLNKLRVKEANYEALEKERYNLANVNSQLKEMLTEAKKDIQKANAKQTEIKSRLTTVQQQLKDKQEYYQLNKNKNWEESQRQINELKEKSKRFQQTFKETEKNWQNERDQLRASLQSSYNDRDQLELMLEQRDELIQRQQYEIIEGQKRIISLNNELRNCLQAWEKEKNAAIPSRRQVSKIEEDLGKFQNYANDLQRKTKQILSLSGVKAKDDLMATITQSLIQLLQVHHKAKSRALTAVQQNKRGEITKDYDKMKDIIEKILKIQQGAEK